MKYKILCLGNEFIKIDSLGKKIGEELKKLGFDIINIKDSFQLMEILQTNNAFLVIDVVKDIDSVKFLEIDDLKQNSITSAHDFDAGFVLKLIAESKRIKIIGIPMFGELDIIKKAVKKMISSLK